MSQQLLKEIDDHLSELEYQDEVRKEQEKMHMEYVMSLSGEKFVHDYIADPSAVLAALFEIVRDNKFDECEIGNLAKTLIKGEIEGDL